MAQITVVVLLQKLTQLLSQANNHFPPGLEEDQIQWLSNQFKFIHKFLLYSEEASRTHDDLQKLVDEIRDLAHQSEDVVDSYVSHVAVAAKQSSSNRYSTDNTFATIQVNDHTEKLRNLRMDTEKIINRINIIYSKRYEYGIKSTIGGEMSKQQGLLRTRSWVVEEDAVVGFTDDSEKLKNRLIGGIWDLDIISIVGEGGTGKTTLAKKIYNDPLVKDYFRSRGWMLVSNKYRLRDLLLNILSNVMIITEDISGMDERELKNQLLKQLIGRRYLIVIDDVWDTEAWDKIKDFFPKSRDGSRIILTTRFTEVASSASPNYGFHRLGFLNDDESWELFSKKIFGEKSCPDEFEEHGRAMVTRCCGLPIVIVVVACILAASEKKLGRWFDMRSRIDWKLVKYSDYQLDILTLCYNDLPQHLKPCFLYLCIFPEDFEISVKELIQLWIAEGLIPEAVDKENKVKRSLEDVGEDYLEGLISRNLIQVTKRRSDGGAKFCRIHDFVRDLCIDLSLKEKFLQVYTGSGGDSNHKEPRRLSILSDCGGYVSNSNTSSNSSYVRSFSCFSQDTRSVLEENWETFFQQLPLLRVLNLGEGEVGKLPKAIEGLFHLRYLRVRPAENTSIPKSLFNLWNLQTIDLRKSRIPKLPEGIWKMQQLRHLYLDGASRLPKPKREECRLLNLHTLSHISNNSERDIYISKRAPNLRKLGLFRYQCVSKREQEFTFDLPHLQSLKFVKECIFEEVINLPDTITKITVKGSPLQPNVIVMFEKLPNLKTLKLVQTSFEDDELVFGKDSFLQLQLLKFEDSKIVTWKLEEGAMPNLLRLVISNCPLLTELPDQLLKSNKLRELELFWASTILAKEIAVELEEEEGLNLIIYPPP